MLDSKNSLSQTSKLLEKLPKDEIIASDEMTATCS